MESSDSLQAMYNHFFTTDTVSKLHNCMVKRLELDLWRFCFSEYVSTTEKLYTHCFKQHKFIHERS